MACRPNITDFMIKLMNEYKQLRGKNKDSCGKKFWDLVVITTTDESQEKAYRLQIEEKLARNELPLNLPIHVISDPPGARIGNGGSTLTALEFLADTYKNDVFEKKILMIHAGGWSQRMPSATVLGKIFSLLPHGTPPYQMLDFKLALYWPLVDKIGPGVFLVCADDFVVYSFGEESNSWVIPDQGFTALAHPSPIEIGRTHGVFVVEGDLDASKPTDVKKCLQALQKPTDERMKEHGALLTGESHTFPGDIHIKGRAVYTDSSFYFAVDVMKKLLQFKKEVDDLNCEIDAYGDFLQAVGANATIDYIQQTSNVSEPTPNLIRMRERVFHALNGSDFHVLILNASAFIHIGTAQELIYHFCEDNIFKERMGFENKIFSGLIHTDESDDHEGFLLCADQNVTSKACIMHSIIPSESSVAEKCVIEYCDLEIPVHIKSGCIISNCQLAKKEATPISHDIPHDCFLHTIPVEVNKDTMYVTVFFKTNDDLKKSTSIDNVESLKFMDSTILCYLKSHCLKKEDILPSKNSSDKVNLWNLKLYPAKPTMTSSLESAISSLSLMGSCEETSAQHYHDETYVSLADILTSKDVEQMLKFRKDLYDKIKLLCLK